jgi:hypothetical protein
LSYEVVFDGFVTARAQDRIHGADAHPDPERCVLPPLLLVVGQRPALATTGLGLGPNSNDYRDLVALWTESRVSHGVGSVDTFTDRRMSARGQLRKEALESLNRRSR